MFWASVRQLNLYSHHIALHRHITLQTVTYLSGLNLRTTHLYKAICCSPQLYKVGFIAWKQNASVLHSTSAKYHCQNTINYGLVVF